MIFVAALFVTLGAGVFVIKYHHVVFAGAIDRHDYRAKQASHVGEPLRFGGVAVFTGLVASVAISPAGDDKILFLLILLSAVPVVLIGLLEDMGHPMSPRRRLLAAAVSATAAVALLGVWVPRADLPVFDWVMSFYIIAVGLTVLFSAGFCHAVNLIDGMNGLATVNVILSALGLAVIANLAGHPAIAMFALLVTTCLLGFLLLNWPSAMMFLGDAGAYGLGHLLTWVAVLLIARADEVAVPALILTLFWPLADVFHTIFRRLAANKAAFEPDRMHLHHKIRRLLDMVFFGYNARTKSNPMTTVLLAPFMAVPVVTGVLLYRQPDLAWVALLLYILAFAIAHRVLPRIARQFRKV